MIGGEFRFFAPKTLDEALRLVQTHGASGKVLAGGMSLLPMMTLGLLHPEAIISLNHVSGLDGVEDGEKCLRIGAMTVQSVAEHDPLVAQHTPLLHEAIPNIAHSQIRNRGTVGGSIAHADPASELPVICLALNARMRARSRAGERWIKAKDFFAGLFATALKPDELLVEIEFPEMPATIGYAFMEIARRHGDYAMAGVAALLSLDADGKCAQVRLVYLNVGDGPVDATQAAGSLAGKPPTEDVFKEAGQIASQQEMAPFGNLHASADFQRHLSAIVTERALAKAYERVRFSRVP